MYEPRMIDRLGSWLAIHTLLSEPVSLRVLNRVSDWRDAHRAWSDLMEGHIRFVEGFGAALDELLDFRQRGALKMRVDRDLMTVPIRSLSQSLVVLLRSDLEIRDQMPVALAPRIRAILEADRPTEVDVVALLDSVPPGSIEELRKVSARITSWLVRLVNTTMQLAGREVTAEAVDRASSLVKEEKRQEM